MAADGTQGSADEQDARNQVVADTIKIVSARRCLGLYGRLCPVPRPSLRPDPADRLLPAAGGVRAGLRYVARLAAAGAAARLALHRRRSGQKAAAIDAEAGKLQKAPTAKTAEFMAEALEKELLKFPEEQRGACETPAKAAEKDRPRSKRNCSTKTPA